MVPPRALKFGSFRKFCILHLRILGHCHFKKDLHKAKVQYEAVPFIIMPIRTI